MGWRGGAGGEESHVNAVLLPSSTLRKDDRTQYNVGRPWHYPLLVEKAGLAGPVDTSDPGGGAKQIQTSSKLQPNFLGPKHSILWKDLKCVVCRLSSVICTY